MPAANFAKATTPLSALSSMTPSSSATTAVQSGPYTKAQFQTTMEGSRTIKNPKEVEQILRDYPAALELYRTGKYKVKVKCEVDVERVILVEKRSVRNTGNSSTPTNNVQENNQTVPDLSMNMEQCREVEKERDSRPLSSRTGSQDRIAPTSTTSISNGMNMVHATISSISMANMNQPKVDHQRAVSNEREDTMALQKNQSNQQTDPSDNNHQNTTSVKQQGDKINRDYPKTMVPFVPQANKLGNLWQQPRFQQPYFSNPLFQQQQQQQQQQQPRPNLFMPTPFLPQQNPQYRQPYYFVQRPAAPAPFQQQQTIYPISSTGAVLKPSLQSANQYTPSCQSVTNIVGLPPTFRTFHANQPPPPPPPMKLPSIRPMYPLQLQPQPQIPFPINQQLANVSKEQLHPMMNPTSAFSVQRPRGARHRAHSVDVGPRNRSSLQSSNQHPQTNGAFLQHYQHYHHHNRHHHHHQQQQQQQQQKQQLQQQQRGRPNPTTTNVDLPAINGKESTIASKERTSGTNTEKLTIRELNETFNRIDPSGRLPYSSLPGVLQRYGIVLVENNLLSAAKELEYNLNEPVSARRLVHLLIKLGKITKSNQQPRQTASPSMLPEDREVTDIMTQRNPATSP